MILNFFFQAEDGIRDTSVTGVQTCALPICWTGGQADGRVFQHPPNPSVRLSACPTREDAIPTATVTAVPSGTYHGQASPRSQCHGKRGITAPKTIGLMTAAAATMARMTSRWRARGQAPPSM